MDRFDLPHIVQRRSLAVQAAANQIATARLGAVEWQQFGEMVFKYQAEFLVLGGIGPFGGQALAQAGVANLGNQIMDGRQAFLLLACASLGTTGSCSFSTSVGLVTFITIICYRVLLAHPHRRRVPTHPPRKP